MKAFVFPGQGAQFRGMGKNLYEKYSEAREIFIKADQVLGYALSEVMFEGTEEQLKETKITQPAVFVHSMVAYQLFGVKPDMVAGHSLGEISALVAAGGLSFEDGLKVVSARASLMQKACEVQSTTMAAILGLSDEIVRQTCEEVLEGVVVAANYNAPGQVVISGTVEAVQQACDRLKEKGAKRTVILAVGGAFHSPLMSQAKEGLANFLKEVEFLDTNVPIYQNATACPQKTGVLIKKHLIEQLTSPVKWTQSIQKMVADGAHCFYELGPGSVLKGLVRKIYPEAVFEDSGF